jgi:hypothetical protein
MRHITRLALLALVACTPASVEPCDTGLQRCTSGCVDLTSDATHCGACDTVCAAGSVCQVGACVTSCPTSQLACDGGCVDPTSDGAHCGSCGTACVTGSHCVAGLCTPVCAAEQQLCDGGCVNLASDPAHCGSCTSSCPGTEHCATGSCTPTCTTPQVLCGSACVDPRSDSQHCGTCTQVCDAVAHGQQGCTGGACHLVSCDPGFVDADGQYANGCELDVRSDLANCGGAGITCSPGAHVATAACVMGVCGVATCAQGFADCDGVATNGCEVDLRNTAAHCGACTTACTASPNATPSCVAGACAPQCLTGFGDCDHAAANGCEVRLNSSSDCGACGVACTAANGTASCASGTCEVTSCTQGYADCDQSAVNGCEASLSSTTDCGACGVSCSGPNAQFQCSHASCQVAACAAGFSDCDANPSDGCEVRLASDLSNCGQCGNACSTNHAQPSCLAGTCGIAACAQGFADCDASPINGCELEVDTNPSNCGGCGHVCTLAHATPGCASGRCTIAQCAQGYADCDLSAANGCEAKLASDVGNGGQCGTVCSINNATPGCLNGSCIIAACAQGYGDCDGVRANGCEQSLTLDTNCGGCGIVCSAGKHCVGGSCS